MKGSAYKPTSTERETIIRFDESSDTATVYTHSKKLWHRLILLSEKYPDQFRLISQDDYSVRYSVPKKCISIREPFSEERRRTYSQYAKEHNFRPR